MKFQDNWPFFMEVTAQNVKLKTRKQASREKYHFWFLVKFITGSPPKPSLFEKKRIIKIGASVQKLSVTIH